MKNQLRTEPGDKKVSATPCGTLYIVATPIGNLNDFSSRAIATLQNDVAVIACEDTRHSQILLQHHAISTPRISLHTHNEMSRSQELLSRLQKGESVALISDAGTPLISDPGARLVALAHQHRVGVSPIPGACAAIAALSASGCEAASFTFVGFLAHKGKIREKQLAAWMSYPTALVFYESPRRTINFFKICIACEKTSSQPQRHYTLAREITKRFETIIQGCAAEILEKIEQPEYTLKGECVIIADLKKNGETEKTASENETSMQKKEEEVPLYEDDQAKKSSPEYMLSILKKHLSTRQAVAICCELTGMKKNQIYELALRIDASQNDHKKETE
jgi:16S rRNA (cytidine1402-2'-O)-methyltransferase